MDCASANDLGECGFNQSNSDAIVAHICTVRKEWIQCVMRDDAEEYIDSGDGEYVYD